jgi:hypothetical protein
MTYRDLITSRLVDKPYSEVLDLACRIEAKWMLLDGDIDIDVLTSLIKEGIAPLEGVDRGGLIAQLSGRFQDVMELFDNELLTITDFLAGNWE